MHPLKLFDIPRNRLRIVPRSAGAGSGEQFVRSEYARQVWAFRSRKYLKNICLVVVIDADTLEAQERFKQLDSELASISQPVRQSDERIAIFIPKRNIETWIHYLQGTAVNEDDRYRHLERESDCKEQVEALASKCRNRVLLPDKAPSSLKAACDELRRILT